jgi:putative oxidoreductase
MVFKNQSSWLNNNRDMAIETLRIYLGISLLIKGIKFFLDPDQASEYINLTSLPFFDFLSLHIVAVVHIAGGILLAIGLITRIAALIQVPILLGAVFFVHLQQGMFSHGQDLEYVILVLLLLLVFTVYGGGRLSVDYILEKREPEND